jgi:alpha-galactosidase/6-phospho-beta-glucosidase family protein
MENIKKEEMLRVVNENIAKLKNKEYTLYFFVLDTKGNPSASLEYIYQAAYLDPHTRDQLTFDEIKALCDDLIEAHGDWLPKFE